MITFNKQKDCEEFLSKVTKLPPEAFIGLARLLDVKMTYANLETNETGLRDAEEVLQDCLNEFRKLKHKERKIVLKAMEVKNGTPTEH